MSQKAFASRLYYGCGCFLLFFIAAAASFNGYYDKWHFREAGFANQSSPRAGFEAMVNGTADRPFAYRQLLPTVANWIDRRVPEPTKERLFTSASHSVGLLRDRLSNSPAAQDRVYFFRYWIIYLLDFLFTWLAVYAMYLVAKSAGYAPSTAALAAIVMILLMPYFLSVGGYLYDNPELAFLALAVWMALRFDWWWIIPLAALATWNKESFLAFIPALYPLVRSRVSRIQALAGTAALGLASFAVYFALRSRFQHNPGATVEMHLMDHVRFLLHPARFFFTETTYGVVAFAIFNPLSVALIAWTVCRGWSSLSRPMRRHTQIAAVINFPLYFLFGWPGEVRALSMLYMPLLLLIAANLKGWTDAKSAAELPT
jgi:hypothetical protein